MQFPVSCHDYTYNTLHFIIMAVERADKISRISGRFQFQGNTTVSNIQSTLRQSKVIVVTVGTALLHALRICLYDTLTITLGLSLGKCS
jgi:hypothetical protein